MADEDLKPAEGDDQAGTDAGAEAKAVTLTRPAPTVLTQNWPRK
jgi:hypothetical protein